MSSAISRARQAAQSAAGDYLDNDTLIANQAVFDIIDVIDDRGGGYQGQDRWLVKVEPHDPDETQPEGLISLTDNRARRNFFEVIGKELDEAERTDPDNAFVGPCVMVRMKGTKFRYIEIVEWDEQAGRPVLPQGAAVAGASADATEFRTRRPRSSNGQAQPEPEPQPEAPRPFVGAAGGSTGSPTAVAEPVDEQPTREDTRSNQSASAAAFPEFKVWARENGLLKRGRPSADVVDAYERAKRASLGQEEFSQPDPAPAPRARRGGRRAVAEESPAEPVTAPRPAQVGAGAPTRTQRPPEGGAENASELVWKPGMAGTSLEPCEACGQYVHDRVFPSPDNDGAYVLVHARCPAGAEQAVMEARLDRPDPE